MTSTAQGATEAPAASPAPSAVLDARRRTWPEALTGALSLVLIASLALPWYRVSSGCRGAAAFTCARFTPVQVSGPAGHPFLLVTGLVTVIIVILVAARLAAGQPFLGWPSDRYLLAAACLNLLIVALAFALSAGYTAPQTPFAPLPPPPTFDVGLHYGAYVSLVVAALAVIAAVLNVAMTPASDDPAGGLPGE